MPSSSTLGPSASRPHSVDWLTKMPWWPVFPFTRERGGGEGEGKEFSKCGFEEQEDGI
jgi:hypothetical protein